MQRAPQVWMAGVPLHEVGWDVGCRMAAITASRGQQHLALALTQMLTRIDTRHDD